MSKAPGVRITALSIFGLGLLALSAALVTAGCGGDAGDSNDGNSGAAVSGLTFEMHHNPG